MKNLKALLIIVMALILTVNSAKSQDTQEKEYKFTIKTNPLSALGGPFWVVVIPVTGEYKVLLETAISKKSSFQAGLSYIGPSILINLDELTAEGGDIAGLKTSGFRGQGWYKFFISRDLQAPEGFYIGPHFSYATATIKSKENEADYIKGSKLHFNGVIGYQMITTGGFTLDVFTGMGFVSRKYTVGGTNFDPEGFKSRNSVAIPFGLSFGYAF